MRCLGYLVQSGPRPGQDWGRSHWVLEEQSVAHLACDTPPTAHRSRAPVPPVYTQSGKREEVRWGEGVEKGEGKEEEVKRVEKEGDHT